MNTTFTRIFRIFVRSGKRSAWGRVQDVLSKKRCRGEFHISASIVIHWYSWVMASTKEESVQQSQAQLEALQWISHVIRRRPKICWKPRRSLFPKEGSYTVKRLWIPPSKASNIP